MHGRQPPASWFPASQSAQTAARSGAHLCQPPVYQAQLPLRVVYHDVVRLDVAVHDALGVAKVQRLDRRGGRQRMRGKPGGAAVSSAAGGKEDAGPGRGAGALLLDPLNSTHPQSTNNGKRVTLRISMT